MGWLFGKKKIEPKVPLPPGRAVDPSSLKFPEQSAPEKVIEPQKIKGAVGVGKPVEISKQGKVPDLPKPIAPAPTPSGGQPSEQIVAKPKLEPQSNLAPPPIPEGQGIGLIKSSFEEQPHPFLETGPLFVKINVYQRVLGEIKGLKEEVANLGDISSALETSEYNEEQNFERLKRAVKVMHDRLLQTDRTLFKS
tara:strand:+ start:674 stop:1255 length:582 start_codon:yes stop_codon:yes gene_type:complete